MTYTIVLSGPAQARTKVERALSELPGIDVLQTTHHYGLEHAKGEKFLTVEGDCDSELPEALRAMNRANATAEPFGWRLRMHGEKPEPTPVLDPLADIRDRLARLEIDHGLLSPASMTLESPAAFNQSGSYTAEQSRRAWYFPINTAGGVKATGDLLTTAPVSGMSVNNAVGELIIPGTESTSQGMYYARCSATQNTSVSTSNPSNPRIDTVCATVSDSGYTEPSGGSGNQWSIQVVAGTPTAGATLSNLNGKAALPASSLLIAYVLVPASATNIITADIGDARVFASVAGLPVNLTYPALTMLSGHQGGTVSLGVNTPTSIISTSSLAVGTWFVIMNIAGVTNANGAVEMHITNGTATSTFDGTTAAGADTPSSASSVALSIAFTAVVTVAGTLTLVGEGSAVTATNAIGTTRAFSFTNSIGWVALRTA